jgi:diadenosine tetraphosphate (Ap4A) HIT family hydrolase
VDEVNKVCEAGDCNISLNLGKKAGQRLEHLHFWVIVRRGEEGLPSENLGLSALIKLVNSR